MTSRRRISTTERRARLARRHHLATGSRSNDVVRVAGDLVGLHATDPATVFVSAAARARNSKTTVGDLERALYEERTLVRTLGMRRTMFVVPVEAVPVIHAACTEALVPGERTRLLRMIADTGIADDPDAWVADLERRTLSHLRQVGEATGAELSKAVPDLSRQIPYGEGKSWAGTMGLTTRILFLLSTAQQAVRGRPRGSWTSSQYRWAPMENWLPGGVPIISSADARAELVRRYLAAFGPVTTTDVKWWTGWTVAATRAALEAVQAVEVDLDDGGSGWVFAGDAAVRSPAPWVAFLPSLDPTIMGWHQRHWYLGEHVRAVFDRNGNAGPTVWVDGRVVGGWTQRRSGEVVYRLLEDVGGEAESGVEVAAHDLREWLGAVRILPRFPTPLQKALTRNGPE